MFPRFLRCNAYENRVVLFAYEHKAKGERFDALIRSFSRYEMDEAQKEALRKTWDLA